MPTTIDAMEPLSEGEGREGPDAPASKEDTATARPGGKLKKIGVLLGILTALTGAAFAVALYVLKPLLVVDAKGAAAKVHAKPTPGKILPLDPVIVNIAGTDGRRYLKTTVQIEIPDDEKQFKEVQTRKALLIDRLIGILSRKPLHEVTTIGSVDRLRQEIAEKFKQELGGERLRAVYLTEFVIQ
jgi:flagellar basal body-associated protein FliL